MQAVLIIVLQVLLYHYSYFLFLFSVYDDSRGKLLRGRKTMLRLCAAQLKDQIANGTTSQRPIWIDLGGGTGKTYILFC